jgi:hypothetical protein
VMEEIELSFSRRRKRKAGHERRHWARAIPTGGNS